MRRSGLLTAVFALAVGIVAAFGASPWRGTAAATRARLSPARVVQRLFAWHGLTG
jgi:hypothetical protein